MGPHINLTAAKAAAHMASITRLTRIFCNTKASRRATDSSIARSCSQVLRSSDAKLPTPLHANKAMSSNREHNLSYWPEPDR